MKNIHIELTEDEAKYAKHGLVKEGSLWDKLVRNDLEGHTKEEGIKIVNIIESAKDKIDKALELPKEKP